MAQITISSRWHVVNKDNESMFATQTKVDMRTLIDNIGATFPADWRVVELFADLEILHSWSIAEFKDYYARMLGEFVSRYSTPA